MKIRNYEVVINEKDAQCGVIIKKDVYDISFFIDQDIYYQVDFHKKTLTIESKNHLIKKVVLMNADNEFLYYAVKSLNLFIMLSSDNPPKMERMTAELL